MGNDGIYFPAVLTYISAVTSATLSAEASVHNCFFPLNDIVLDALMDTMIMQVSSKSKTRLGRK